MIASQSFVAARATKSRRWSLPRSSDEAASTRACGYACNHSRENCSSIWLGTAMQGLLISPILLSSVAPTTISSVFPAPTEWNRPTAGSAIIRATAARWCGRSWMVSASPGVVRCSPAAL